MAGTTACTRNAAEDIWGERTPYKHVWPTRVDQHTIEEPEKWVQGACVMCSNGCGLDYAVKNQRVVGVRGRVADRVNKGRLGPKGLYAWNALNHKDRLKYPQIRRNGKLERATWDEAMGLIVEKTRDCCKRLTNHGVAFYTSGQLFLEEYYALAVVGKAGLNTLHMDGNTRLCTATAAASMRESFGSDGQPGSYTDIDFTDCIMMVGHNMASTQTVLWSRILDRLHGDDPPKLIVIDTRLSESARQATLHLSPRVGTNLALLNGLEHLLFEYKYIDEEWIAEHVYGREELQKVVQKYTPSFVSEITGVPEQDLISAAHIIGKSKGLLSTALQGVYQSNQATASACQINNINLLLGRIGKPGCGIFQMNGQPTAQNNREVGCDGEFPGFRNHQNPAHMQELADLWNIEFGTVPHWSEPTHVENILKYINSGMIQMLWISGTNPLVSLPNLPMVRATLTKPDLFVVAQDIFPNETTSIADVIIPAAAQGEKTGCFTNVDRTVHISHKAAEPPGEARSDFDIFCDFGKRMDFRCKDGTPLMPWTKPEEAFEAWKRLSKGRPCDYSALTYDKLTGGSGIQWPCTEQNPFGTERLFTDGKFFTDADYCETYGHDLQTGAPLSKAAYLQMNPAGRAIFKACDYLEAMEVVDDEYPLQLSNGRITRHFHTRTKTGRTPELQSRDTEPWLQISQEDAEEHGLSEGDFALVESRRGKIELRARIGDIGKGRVFIPFHFGYFDATEGRARAANELTQEQWDPVSKQPLFKSGAVKVTKLPASAVDSDAPLAAPEQHTAATHRVETTPTSLPTTTRHARFLEPHLGATHESLRCLGAICTDLVPRLAHDREVSAGMHVVRGLLDGCVATLQPYAERYAADVAFGREIAAVLRRQLFPVDDLAGGISGSGLFDCLLALQGVYVFVGYVESHLVVLRPTSQASWDTGFTEAVGVVSGEMERVKAWTVQQLAARGSQVLLVPCEEASGLKSRVEKRLTRW